MLFLASPESADISTAVWSASIVTPPLPPQKTALSRHVSLSNTAHPPFSPHRGSSFSPFLHARSIFYSVSQHLAKNSTVDKGCGEQQRRWLGYPRVCLCRNTRKIKVTTHSAVWENFLAKLKSFVSPLPPKKSQNCELLSLTQISKSWCTKKLYFLKMLANFGKSREREGRCTWYVVLIQYNTLPQPRVPREGLSRLLQWKSFLVSQGWNYSVWISLFLYQQKT